MGHFDAGARCLNDFHGLGDDFRAYTVSRNDGDTLFGTHGMEGYQLARQRAKQETKKWRTGVLARPTSQRYIIKAIENERDHTTKRSGRSLLGPGSASRRLWRRPLRIPGAGY